MKTARSLAVQEHCTAGFTLVDLLALIVIFGVLSAVLLPALASTKPNSQAFQCVENQRQLVRAWQMYAQDNNGQLARNGDESTQPTSDTDTTSQYAIQWCPGREDFGAAGQATDVNWIKLGCIYPYVKTVTPYRCPADNSSALVNGQIQPRTRSISMNGWIGPYNIWNANGTASIFYKESDLGIMGPANLWLIVDENPYSINDGYFAVYPAAPNLTWVDYPAAYHNGGGGISFCDGSAEIRKWTDPVLLGMKQQNPTSLPATPGNADLPWLQAHSTKAK